MAINQIIHTIQGEGQTCGIPCVLVRLDGCNCHCPWCDTKQTWVHCAPRITEEELENVIVAKNKMPAITTLMVTGGEPTLYVDDPNFQKMINLGWTNVIIETNGTRLHNLKKLLDSDKLTPYLNISISPKLDIKYYNDQHDYQQMLNNISNIAPNLDIFKAVASIKLVYNEFEEDVILKFIEDTNIRGNIDVYIMTQTPRRENDELKWLRKVHELDLKTIAFCMNNGLIFSPRLHLDLFCSYENYQTEMSNIIK